MLKLPKVFAIGKFGLLSLILALFLVSGHFLSSPAYAASGINKVINFQGKVVNSDGTNVSDGTYSFIFKMYDGPGSAASTTYTEDWTKSGLFSQALTGVAVTTSSDGTVSFASSATNCSTLQVGQLLTNTTKGESTYITDVTNACTGSVTVAKTPSTWATSDTVTNQIYVKNGIFKAAIGSLTAISGPDWTTNNIYLGINFNADGEMKPRIQYTAVPYAFNAEKVNGLTVQNTSGNPFASTTTLQIGDGKTVKFNNGLTFSGTDGKTMTFNNSLTFSGTDSTSFTFPSTSGGTVLTTTQPSQVITSAQTSGTLFKLLENATLAGSTTGLHVDLSASTTNAAQSVTGELLAMPTTTAAASSTLKALSITSGAVTNSSGTSTWTGLDLAMPSITQSSGTLTSYGIKITGGTVTSGTAYALITDAAAGNVGIGSATPGTTLDVSGTGRFSSTLTASNGLTLTTGTLSLTSTGGNVDLSGSSGTFLTSTGANTLSGTTTVASTKNFIAGQTTGKVAFGGAVAGGDILALITADSTQDWAKPMEITQADDAAEDTYTLSLSSSAFPPTLSGTSRAINGLSSSVAPASSVSITNVGTLNINGISNTINDSSKVSFGTNTSVGNFANIYGVNTSITASPVYASTATAGDQYIVYGDNTSINGSPTLTNVPSGSKYTIYGGYFSNLVTSAGNANLTAAAYGVAGFADAALTTTGTTSNTGGYFEASGTADNNYGLYVNTAASATNNYGLYINTVAAASTNYALYSNAAAQSYFAGNIGIGSTTPGNWLDVAAPTTAKAQLLLTKSAGVDPSSPAEGMLWYNGTNLYFRNSTTNKDLLASGGSSQWTTSGSAIYYNSGNVSIGTTNVSTSPLLVSGTAPDADSGNIMQVQGTLSSTANPQMGIRSLPTVLTGASSTKQYFAVDAIPLVGNTDSNLSGAQIIALRGGIFKNTTGTVGTGIGLYSENFVLAGTVTNSYGVKVDATAGGGGTVTNQYGMYIGDHTAAATTNVNLAIGPSVPTSGTYSIYNNSTAANYFAGNVAIGTTTTTNGALSVGSTTNLLNISTTGNITAIGGAAHTIQNSSGALNIDSASTGAINIGTSANAKTITIGNNTGATALAFTSGTGSQTFTSSVATTTGTSGAWVFTGNSLTSGTGAYFNSSSLTTGKLVDINTGSANTVTTGSLLNLSSASTALTTGSLISADWTPGSTVTNTATGDLFKLTIGSNGANNSVNFLNFYSGSSSVFSVNQQQFTTSLPTNFTATGDVSIANDINFTNPIASYVKSFAPLYIQAGPSYASNNLTLQTFNNGDIDLQAGGSTRMLVQGSNGNVGIGTTTPAQKLEVSAGGASNVQLRVAAGTNNQSQVAFTNTAQGAGGAGFSIGRDLNAGGVNNFFIFDNVNAATRMLIDNAGNVGIGSTSPGFLFDVYKNQNTFTVARVYNDNAGSSASSRIVLGNNTSNVNGQLIQSSSTETSFAGANSLNLYNSSNAPIGFFTSGTERARIDGSGNVGIGTTTTSTAKLYVLGNDNTATTNIISAWSNNQTQGMAFNWGGLYKLSSATNADMDINAKGTGNILLHTGSSGGTASTGNVGIGSAAPSTAKLVVSAATTQIIDAIQSSSLYNYRANNTNAAASGSINYLAENTTAGSANNYFAYWKANGVLNYYVDTTGLIGSAPLAGGATTLSVNASAQIIRTPSDERLKTNIQPLTNILDKVLQLRGVSFVFKDQNFGVGPQIGFIAQDVEKLFPELVSSGGEYKSVNYPLITAVLAEGIKELNTKVDKLALNQNGDILGASTGATVDQTALKDYSFGAVTATSLSAKAIAGLTITADSVSSKNIATVDLTTLNATVSGTLDVDTLRVKRIEGLDIVTDQVASLSAQIASLSKQQATPPTASASALSIPPTATDSASASDSATVALLKQQLMGNVLGAASTSSELQLDKITAVVNLTSTGETRLSHTNIAGKLTVGTMTFDDLDSSLNTFGTLKIQNNVLADAVEFFGGSIKLSKDGTLQTINIHVGGTAVFENPQIISKDSAGMAQILKGDREVLVSFEKPYLHTPLVTAQIVPEQITEDSLKDKIADNTCSKNATVAECQDTLDQQALDSEVKFIVTKKTKEGFTIRLSGGAPFDMNFTWTAVLPQTGQLFTSNPLTKVQKMNHEQPKPLISTLWNITQVEATASSIPKRN